MPQVVRNFQARLAVSLALLVQLQIFILGIVRAQAMQATDLDTQFAGCLAHFLVELAFPGLVGGKQEFLGFVQLVSQIGRQVEGLFESLLADVFDA